MTYSLMFLLGLILKYDPLLLFPWAIQSFLAWIGSVTTIQRLIGLRRISPSIVVVFLALTLLQLLLEALVSSPTLLPLLLILWLLLE